MSIGRKAKEQNMLLFSKTMNIPADELNQTLRWLKNQKVEIDKDYIEQGIREGTLLSRIINNAEGKQVIKGIHERPNSIQAKRINIQKSLNYLRTFPNICSKYIWDIESLLQGDIKSIYNILWEIWKLFGHRTKLIKSKSLQSSVCRSTDIQYWIGKHETIIQWLKDLGLSTSTFTMERRQNELLNGVLLCKIAEIFDNPVQYYNRVIQDYMIDANIKAGVQAIANAGITLNKQKVILAFKQRKAQQIFKFLTYLKQVSYSTNDDDTRQSEYQNKDIKWQEVAQWISHLLKCEIKDINQLIDGIASGLLLDDLIKVAFNKKISGVNRSPVSQMQRLQNVNLCINFLKTLQDVPSDMLQEAKDLVQKKKKPILTLLESFKQFFYEQNTLTLSNFKSQTPKTSTFSQGINSLTISPVKQNFQPFELVKTLKPSPTLTTIIDGFEWLDCLGIQLPIGLNVQSNVLPEFTTGCLLCDIVSSLENKEIKGVDRNCATQASALTNINKALQVLGLKPRFPQDLLDCQLQVFQGDGKTIRKILMGILKAYFNKISQIKTR